MRNQTLDFRRPSPVPEWTVPIWMIPEAGWGLKKTGTLSLTLGRTDPDQLSSRFNTHRVFVTASETSEDRDPGCGAHCAVFLSRMGVFAPDRQLEWGYHRAKTFPPGGFRGHQEARDAVAGFVRFVQEHTVSKEDMRVHGPHGLLWYYIG